MKRGAPAAKAGPAKGDARAHPSAAREVGRQPPAKGMAMLYCPACWQELERQRCKLRCTRCGYFMDCSDYY